jgi:hypothetical protein
MKFSVISLELLESSTIIAIIDLYYSFFGYRGYGAEAISFDRIDRTLVTSDGTGVGQRPCCH